MAAYVLQTALYSEPLSPLIAALFAAAKKMMAG